MRHVRGSNSHDEALFVAVTDLAHSHLLDPATFAVALEAIADIGRVRTKDVIVEGGNAVEISYRPFWVASIAVHSFTIDKEIPAEVLAAFERYGTGSRICANSHSSAMGDAECRVRSKPASAHR